MKDKHAIKNMEYWKKKNNIPGIEALADSGLTDGRAGSSAFQMATPGSSPNKGFLQNIGQGLVGKGKMGFLNPALWAARGVKNTLDADPTTTNVFGGGTGDEAFGGVFGGGQPELQIPQPALATQPQPQVPLAMKKSPFQQEGIEQVSPEQPTEELVMVQADDFENPQTGEMVATENLQIDDSGLIPIVNKEGMYYVTDNEGTEIPVSPDHESIVPRSVVQGVEPGRAMQEAIADYKSGKTNAPLNQKEAVDPTERVYGFDQYEAGDMVSEDDLEEAFTRTGNDPKDYPQLTVQDYSEIRVDEKGMYVQKLKEDEDIKGLEIDNAMGGVGGGGLQMQSPVKNYKNPQDYKVFNFGNKPTPFEKLKKKRY